MAPSTSAEPIMTAEEKDVRLFVYRFVVANDRCPSIDEIADHAGRTPLETQVILERLETVFSALVLSPRSPNLWLADPFAALPTAFPVYAEGHRWYGMCAWDALGILATTGYDGRAPTTCPMSGTKLELRIEDGRLTRGEGVVHFAVPAADWWRHIGFT